MIHVPSSWLCLSAAMINRDGVVTSRDAICLLLIQMAEKECISVVVVCFVCLFVVVCFFVVVVFLI